MRHYNYAGPYEVKKPFLADSLDVNSKRFSDKELLNTTVPFCNLSQSGQTLDAASFVAVSTVITSIIHGFMFPFGSFGCRHKLLTFLLYHAGRAGQ